MATLSTTLAVVAQDSALARDLQSAAVARLEKSATAGERVVEEHLHAVGERYRAIARTPQLRATLELLDQPTLVFLGSELMRQHGASAIAFVNPDGEVLASSGDPSLLEIVPTTDGAQLRARLDRPRPLIHSLGTARDPRKLHLPPRRTPPGRTCRVPDSARLWLPQKTAGDLPDSL
jgi:hypothetical protein